MDIAELQERARVIRSQYALEELRRYFRSWTPEEIMLGCLGDVGDLAKLVQGKAGTESETTSTQRLPMNWPTVSGRYSRSRTATGSSWSPPSSRR